MSGFVLHLLRHAPPRRTGLLLGHTDEPALDPAWPGLLARARTLEIAGIVTSDLRRASVSARLLADALELPLEVDRRWRELDFGRWEGLAADEVPIDDLTRFWADPDSDPPPEGECWRDIRQRVGEALGAFDTPSLVVTHAGAMRAALAVLTGLDHRGVWAVDLPYGALLSLAIRPGEPLSGQVVGLRTEWRG